MAIRETLQAWLRQGYTANETPLDGYGAEVVREVLAALSSAPPDLVPEHVRKHSREVVDMYRGLKPSEQVSRGTLAAMAIGLLERWLTPAPETPAPVAPVDHAPMGMPGDAGHDQWGYPLSLRTSVPDSSPVAPAPPVAPEVLPPSGYKSPMQRHYETPEFKAAWAAGKAERDAASPVVAPAPVVDDPLGMLLLSVSAAEDARMLAALREPGDATLLSNTTVDRTIETLLMVAAALSSRETPDGGGR